METSGKSSRCLKRAQRVMADVCGTLITPFFRHITYLFMGAYAVDFNPVWYDMCCFSTQWPTAEPRADDGLYGAYWMPFLFSLLFCRSLKCGMYDISAMAIYKV